MLRMLSVFVLSQIAIPIGFAATLPGYRPQSLAVVEIEPADLKTLVSALALNGDEVQAAHAALTAYRDAIRQGAAEARAAIAAAKPEGAVEAAGDEVRRTQAMESVRDRIEARRRAGEFAGDEAALREAFQEAAREAQAELDLAVEAGAQLEGWGDAFRLQANVLTQWHDLKDAHTAHVREALNVIAGDERAAALNRWWLETAARRMLKRGRLSAEVFAPASSLDSSDRGTVLFQDAESHWLREHAHVVAARDVALRNLPVRAAEAVATNRPSAWRYALEDAMATREAVRNHAIEGIDMFAVLLDEEDAQGFRERARRAAFPGVWRRDRADRVLHAALEAGGLDAAQRGMVTALRMEHEALVVPLALAHQDAMVHEEGRMLVDQDVAQAARFMRGDQPAASPTPYLDEAKARRKELVDDTLLRLRGILTEAQWDSLPGTRTVPTRD